MRGRACVRVFQLRASFYFSGELLRCVYKRIVNVVKVYCITPIFRVEEIFAIFANLDFAQNFPPAKIISTANGISRNFPPAKFSSREIFLPAKIKF